MPHVPRAFPSRRWWAVGLVGVALIAVGVVSSVSSTPPASDLDAAPAAAVTSAPTTPISGPSPTPDDTATGSWADALGIPADATDEQRLQIKLSYDLVAIASDRLDELRALPGVHAVSPASLDDTTYVAVPAAEIPLVQAHLPEARVIPNEVVEATADQSVAPSWGVDAVDNSAAATDGHYLYDSTGAGVTVYVVDSGAQATHPDFGGRVDAASGHDEVGDGRGTDDCNGHGTHVAGTIGSTTYGVAKNVRIVPVRVFGCGRQGSLVDIYYGILWIYENNAPAQSVINMSLGSPMNTSINNLANQGVDKGFVVVVAAGNDTKDACQTSPASARKVITVGATDSSRALAWYSNYGSCVDILAPGSDITSTYIGSTTAVMSGTSMASPHVAGLAARLLQLNPTWRTAQVQAALTTAAARGHISGLPAGTPNLFAAIPGIPRIATVTASTAPAGMAVSWTTNAIGTFTSFSLTITDTTTGRAYPVTVSGVRASTVFTDVAPTHAYTVQVTGSALMPSGARVSTDPVTIGYTPPP